MREGHRKCQHGNDLQAKGLNSALTTRRRETGLCFLSYCKTQLRESLRPHNYNSIFLIGYEANPVDM